MFIMVPGIYKCPINVSYCYFYFILILFIDFRERQQERGKEGEISICCSMYLPYFFDYKMHRSPQIWEENRGVSYSLNVAYLAHGEGRGIYVIKYFTTFFASKNFFFLFSSSKTYVRLMVRKIQYIFIDCFLYVP